MDNARDTKKNQREEKEGRRQGAGEKKREKGEEKRRASGNDLPLGHGLDILMKKPLSVRHTNELTDDQSKEHVRRCTSSRKLRTRSRGSANSRRVVPRRRTSARVPGERTQPLKPKTPCHFIPGIASQTVLCSTKVQVPSYCDWVLISVPRYCIEVLFFSSICIYI